MAAPAPDPRRPARAAAGLALLAAFALALPHAVAWVRSRAESPRPSVYRHPDTGQLLWAPEGEAPAGASAPGGWEGLLLGRPLDLNAAGPEDLEALPGVGPKTAAAILDTRAALGRFSHVDELRRVPGIGPRTLERLRPLVRVEPAGGGP